MAKIMIQGTASSVGKSILVAALCRIFKQDGYNVVPYKSQNMSLNSYITLDGKEMGRAQVLQAYAAGMEPQAFMNPILLKPTGDRNCQVIVNGKVWGNASAMQYHNMKTQFKGMLKEEFQKLEENFDIVVMEGAGSPAEINLRDRDIVNMGMAELVDAPVLLVGDIDKGGVFASLAGTMLLLTDDEKERVKGTIINKFRGDVNILKPGLDMLEDRIHIPTLGVVPYFRLMLEDEDGAIEFNRKKNSDIDVAVLKLPHISNFTDLDALDIEEDVSIRFVFNKEEFGNPDVVIIPGSKNTLKDLEYVREKGFEELIKEHSKDGLVIGICGGYQMLGKKLKDPYKIESDIGEIDGIGILDIETVFEKEKTMTRVKARSEKFPGEVYGYEIHMGQCQYGDKAEAVFAIFNQNGEDACIMDGAISEDGRVIGTYLHGIFDGTSFREHILNEIREKKGLQKRMSPAYESLREEELDKLADLVRESLDMDAIYKIVGADKK